MSENELREILRWAAKQESGFTWGDLQRQFKFDDQKMNFVRNRLRSNLPASENLVDHVYSSGIDENLLFLRNKGSSLLSTVESRAQLIKKWYEKPSGIVLLGVVITLIGGYLLYRFGWN